MRRMRRSLKSQATVENLEPLKVTLVSDDSLNP